MEYSIIADSYNSLYQEEQLKKLNIIKEILTLKKSYKLLDVGCGTGISTYFFQDNCKVIGIDPCKELISKGKGDLIQASAESIPFSDHYFDIIISVTAIHNFKDIKKSLQEIKRVLKPNGQLVISILKRSSSLTDISILIKKYFKNVKKIEEEKDIIFYKV